MAAVVPSWQGLKPPAGADRQLLIDSDLLAEPRQRREQEAGVFPLFVTLALLFFMGNSGAAIHRARGDPWTVAFVAGVSLNMLLFVALGAHEKAPDGDTSRREQLKVAIWVLATTLNCAFSFHVTEMMPPALLAVICCLAAIAALAGFWLLFVHREGGDDLEACGDEEPPYCPWNESSLDDAAGCRAEDRLQSVNSVTLNL